MTATQHTAPSPGQLRELLAAAVRAPSMHNTQPWRFLVAEADGLIELSVDRDRMLAVADPTGRAAHIACGAALLNLRVAAAAARWRPDVRLQPDLARPLLLAEIRLAEQHEPTARERELSAAIPVRQTNREPFSGQPVPPGIRADLAEAARHEGATLRFPDDNETARLLTLVADAERAQLADPDWRDELARWAGGPRDRDGVPGRALGPQSPTGTEPVRDFGQHDRYAWFEEHPQLAVLSVRASGPPGWLKAGQALERTWLTATSRGISASPLTPPLEDARAWEVHDPQARVGHPQMILRLGYGVPIGPGAPRRPVDDVTSWQHEGTAPEPGGR